MELLDLSYSIGNYAIAASALAIVSHLLIRRFVPACLIAAILCSVVNLAHQEWVSNFGIKPGWALPLLMVGFLSALPVCFAVGLPFQSIRESRRHGAKPGAAVGQVHAKSGMPG